MKQSIMSALAFCVSAVFADVPDGVLMSGTAELTVPGYTLEETLADFPVLVRIPSAITLSCGAEGQYMRFYGEDGSKELAFEIDTWNHGYESLVWVKLPSLAKGTKFLLKYGENFSARTTCDADVWSSYSGVWHLNEIIKLVNNSPEQHISYKDSAGKFSASITYGNRVRTYDGIVGKSFTSCDAATWSSMNGAKLTINSVNGNSASGFTVSWWASSFKPGKINENANVDDKGYVMSHTTWSIFLDNGGAESCRFNFQTKSGNISKTMTVADAESDFNKSDWMFTACSVAPGAEAAIGRIYANAVLKAEDTSFHLADSYAGNLVVGNGSGSKFYPGKIDELRIRNVASSPAWLKAEYETIHNPSFVKIESEATATFYVVPAGTEGNSPCAPYASWASAANSIADVLDKLPDTDSSITIRVAPGVYYPLARCTIGIPNLTIVSDDGTGKTSYETTVIDGGYPERTNGIFSVSAANVTVRGITFRNSRATGDGLGGAVYADAAGVNPVFSECFFTNCIAYKGGGIYLTDSKAKIESCRFEDCHATVVDLSKAGQRNGGGVYINAASEGMSISNCIFSACSAYQGGGVHFPSPPGGLGFEKSAFPVIYGCTFAKNFPARQNNDGTPSGGGVFGRAWVENCRFDANYTPDGNCFNSAIGFGYNIVITNCVFENHSSGNRGVIGQHKAGSYETKVVDCVFRGNTANMLGLGAITVDRCIFTNNAISVSLFWDSNGSSRYSIVRNSLYAYNHQPLRPAGARFENCTVAGNAGGVFIDNYDSKGSVFVNCYIGGNTNMSVRLSQYRGNANFGYYRPYWSGEALTAQFSATNCVIEGGHKLETANTAEFFDLFEHPQAENCLAVTDLVEQKGPGFIDPANGNWRLSRKSPLRDAGIHRSWMDSSSRDLDGNARKIDIYGKEFSAAALPDIGCYECDRARAMGMRLFVR